MKMELLVDAGEFWPRLKADIAAAKDRIYIQTLSFEGDTVGLALADAMRRSPASDKRIIVDYYTKYIISDKFLPAPRNRMNKELRDEERRTIAMIAELNSDSVAVRFVNPMGFMLCRIPSRNHKKIIVIDGQIGYIGGINFSEHNFAWHDLMVRIEDAGAAQFMAGDFLVSWEGRHFGGNRKFEGFEIISCGGHDNRQRFSTLMDLIDGARKSIFVESPYLSFPFTDRLREAAGRGVAVQVVSPANNNKKFMREYIAWEARRSGFNLRLFRDRMTHLKAMLIDDEYLAVGSCNFDYFSYCFEQEIIGIITDKDFIADFKKRVVLPDIGNSFEAVEKSGNLRGRWMNFKLRAGGKLAGLFN